MPCASIFVAISGESSERLGECGLSSMNTPMRSPRPRLSVVIPVLNEAPSLTRFLTRLQPWREAGHELIVIDGESEDDSAALAIPLADSVKIAPPSRAGQMRVGAALASGDLLLFLHADTDLPLNAPELIEGALEHGAGWGWFDVTLDAPGLAFRIIGAAMNTRARLTRVCTGDQALFVRRELYSRLGGFPRYPLMEDVAFSKRLRAVAAAGVISTPGITSSRRWQKKGVLRTVLLMWELRLRYFFGESPVSLHRRYYPASRPQVLKYPQARVRVFAKEPVAGQVKTRLIPALGAEQAMALHCAMVGRIAGMLSGSSLAPWGFSVAGDQTHLLFSGRGASLAAVPQRGADLGERMALSARNSLAGLDEVDPGEAGLDEGAVGAVVLVGADCPALTAEVLEQALASLTQGAEVVFVPALDGGYVLLGMTRFVPELFDNIAWGTPVVLAQSLERLRGVGIEATCLAPLWDVDTEDDLVLLEGLEPPLSF